MINDPKYKVIDGELCNSQTLKPIPADEPVFILRAKDKNADLAISFYKELCGDNPEFKDFVSKRLHDFVKFAHTHPGTMKAGD